MKVRIQFFSRLRDLARTSEMEMEVPETTTAAELLEALFLKTPSLRDWNKSILIASGLEFVERSYLLRPDDEISIMPPVQGG